ncbi:MAG: hypothetical protein GF308_00030 [Candidatus Heimdallarchaeota archaeon]|nr:hypothetical protein [Candidatus Heimdallarchaeota archaeon]
MSFRKISFPQSTPIGWLSSWQELPSEIQGALYTAITVLLSFCVGLGVLLAIVGTIQWATGWDDRGGKKLIVKGVVLVLIGSISGGGMLLVSTF